MLSILARMATLGELVRKRSLPPAVLRKSMATPSFTAIAVSSGMRAKPFGVEISPWMRKGVSRELKKFRVFDYGFYLKISINFVYGIHVCILLREILTILV